MKDNSGAYLDRFPLSQSELDRALERYPYCCHADASSSPSNDNPSNSDTATAALLLLPSTIDRIYEYDNDIYKYLEAVVRLCGKRGMDGVWEALWRQAQLQQHPRHELAMLLSQFCTSFNDIKKWQTVLETLPETVTTLVPFQRWANRVLPNAARVVAQTHAAYFLDQHHSTLPLPLPSLLPSFIANDTLWQQLFLMDVLGSETETTNRHPLYRSQTDGLHFRTFAAALEQYHGPTLVLIQTTANDVLGYLSEVPWKSGGKGWFTACNDQPMESFLFRLHPCWNVYHCPVPDMASGDGVAEATTPWITTNKTPYHQLLQLPPPLHKNIGLTGWAVDGVTIDHPRLHLTTSLEQCLATGFGTYFENGPLLSNPDSSYFDVEKLEVWAVRVTAEQFAVKMQQQAERNECQESRRIQRAKVDKTAFVQDFVSGGYKVFQHRGQVRSDSDVA